LPSLRRTRDRLFYGWVILAALLIINTVTQGLSNSFGVFFKSLEGEFGLTRMATSGIFSTHMALGCVVSIIGGWALDRYGPRTIIFLMGLFAGLSLLLTSQVNSSWQLFVTYSLLLSIGTGSIYVITMATILRWFDKKQGLALGIAGSGAGLGTLAIAPLATHLISNSGWRTAYLLMGLAALLIVIPLSRLLSKGPSEIEARPGGVKPGSSGERELEKTGREDSARLAGFSLPQASKTRNFWLLGSVWLLYSFCFLLILTHIVRHAIDMGIPAMEAAAILSLMGGSNIAGRLLMGRASDSLGRKATAITCALLAAGAMTSLIWSQELCMLYLVGIVCGFSFGGLDPSVTALIGDSFGLRNIGVIMGTLNIAWGIGAATGPAIGGLIFDVTGSYAAAFSIGATAMLAVALLIALSKRGIKEGF